MTTTTLTPDQELAATKAYLLDRIDHLHREVTSGHAPSSAACFAVVSHAHDTYLVAWLEAVIAHSNAGRP
jgi:hypothetical protein